MPVIQSVFRSVVRAESLLTSAPFAYASASASPSTPLHKGLVFFCFFFLNAIRNGPQIPLAFAFEWVICVDFCRARSNDSIEI